MPGISAIYLLDLKGKVLIARVYRDLVSINGGDSTTAPAASSHSIIEKFITLVAEREDQQESANGNAGVQQFMVYNSVPSGPVIPIPSATTASSTGHVSYDGGSFLWLKLPCLYVVALVPPASATTSTNAAMVFTFLYKIVSIFQEYFKELEEESIRDNFVLIYELLDEVCDWGFPQTTDTKILQEYITQEGQKLETQALRPPPAVTNAVSWRTEGIKYRKNEVFLDVVESVNMLANSTGTVLRSEIVGAIKMRVYLTGMPELRLGLNDKV